MAQAFEELISQQIDHLYRGALFVAGGDVGEAEDLLVDTAAAASRRFRVGRPVLDVPRWLEGVLVERLLVRSPLEVSGEPTDDPLLAAAGSLPASARAALWLTVMCRWSYRDTAAVLSVQNRELVELLKQRDVLYSALSGARVRKNGTEA